MSWLRRIWLLMLVLGTVVSPRLASAQAPLGLETRIGGLDLAAQVIVGVHGLASPGSYLGNPDGYDENASGCSLAAGGAVNRAGRGYPQVRNPGTGELIPQPGAGLRRVPVAERVPWGAQERGAFVREWYDRGLPTPEGGWARYDIHHIQPREFGGTNAFENLVPVERSVHQTQFNAWWRDY